MIWLQMVWYFSSRIKLITLSLIKSALLVSIPGFTLSNLKHAKHNFQTTLNSVTLSAVGYTGCAHHNGPFLKRTNHKLHSAELLHDSSGMLRHRHQPPRDPRWVWISPSIRWLTPQQLQDTHWRLISLSQHCCAGLLHDLVTNGLVFQLTKRTDHLSLIKSALPVSIPGSTLRNPKPAHHYFQKTLNSVTLSAVGCTGCAHHNGPFFKEG